MLIYTKQKAFAGIDESTLRRIGYNTIAELKEDAVDFADLFDNKPGLLHNFKNFSWIDFLLHSDKEDVKANIRCNGKVYSCGFKVEAYYFTTLSEDENRGYSITLTDLQILADDDGSVPREVLAPQDLSQNMAATLNIPTQPSMVDAIQTPEIANLEPVVPSVPQQSTPVTPEVTPSKKGEQTRKLDVDDVLVETPTPQPLSSSIVLNTPSDYLFDPSIAADELGLPSDLIDEFVGDFIQQAEKFQPDILEALQHEDFETIQILSHKLKGVAANLRIEDALEVLTFINSSKDIALLKEYLKSFSIIMHKLSGATLSLPTSTQDVDTVEVTAEPAIDEPLPELHDEDEIYDFEPLEMKEPSLNDDEPVESLEIPADELKEYISEFVDQANFMKTDFQDALKDENFDAIKNIASTLKGMSMNLELDHLTQLLEKIQTTNEIKEAISNAKELFIAIRKL